MMKTRLAKPSVAVDFDGVIHAYSQGWHDGTIYDEPMPGAIEGLKRLQQRYAVFVFTTRNPATVGRWLKKHGIETAWHEDENTLPEFWNDDQTVLVTRRKLPAIAYLDDRAVRFTDWASVDAQLEAVS